MSRPINGDDVFRAVAHPVRRRVLELLRDGERGMGELAAPFRMSLPCFSNHLRVLREAGLVTQRRAGIRRVYRLRSDKLRQINAWLARVGSPAPASSRSARPSRSTRPSQRRVRA